jgi:two-component system response regulator DctR
MYAYPIDYGSLEDLMMSAASNSTKILIVDDDDDLASGLEFLLTTKKWSTQRFSSGESFIASIEEDVTLVSNPGAILLDVRMLGISGFDVFYWLQSNHPDASKPIIFLTGHGELPQAVQMMKRGAFDFIQKPFDSSNLLSLIDSAVKESHARFSAVETVHQALDLLKTLTDKERLVMDSIFNGDSNREIADLLGNSVRTVELHRASIFHKLKVKNAIELTRFLKRLEKNSHIKQ